MRCRGCWPRRSRRWVALLALGFSAPVPALATAKGALPPPGAVDPEAHQNAYVDWASRRLFVHVEAQASGSDRLLRDVLALGEQLAKRKAHRRLTELVQNMPVGGGAASPKAWLAGTPKWSAYLARAVENLTVVATNYGADGRVVLEATLPLEGGPARLGSLWRAFRQATPQPSGPATVAAAHGASEPHRASSAEAQVGRAADGRLATGIVLQTKGLHMAAALWPRIFDAAGVELYGPDVVHPDVLEARGLATVHPGLEDALRDPRVSERAIVVRAERLGAAAASDVVVSAADAALLRRYVGLLKDGRIAFCVDEAPDAGARPRHPGP